MQQHSQEELRGGVRGHQEQVDLGAPGRGHQQQEQEIGGVGGARDLSQRPAATTTQAERLGINSNIYSLYQGHLAGPAE